MEEKKIKNKKKLKVAALDINNLTGQYDEQSEKEISLRKLGNRRVYIGQPLSKCSD
jgi:hypothetical protein